MVKKRANSAPFGDCRFAACAFSGSLRGLESVPAKQRSLVPPTSTQRGITPAVWRLECLDSEQPPEMV